MLNQNQLKEVLSYNPITGKFIWLKTKTNFIKVGDVAGCNLHGYVVIRINRKGYKAHRLAWLYMNGEWPEDQIDHINHIRNDNRIINLREATCCENGKNQSLNKNNTSGVTGVVWHIHQEKWQSQIKQMGKQIFLGKFHDKFEAFCARLSANNKYGYHQNHGKPI